MKKIEEFFDKLVTSNIENVVIKQIFLYNTLYFSIFRLTEFVFLSISLKNGKIYVTPYIGSELQLYKIMLALIKKHESVFLSYIKMKQITFSQMGEEVDFINIYDKEDLNLDQISERLFFTFLDDYTFRRRGEMDFKIEDKSVLQVYHSDFECSKCSGPVEAFTNFSETNSKDFTDELPNETHTNFLQLNTYISDYESIAMGGNQKLQEILQNKQLIDSYDLIAVNKTCISVIMGDDVESILSYNNIPKEKTFYTDQNVDSGYITAINFLKNYDINLKTKLSEKIVFFGLKKSKNTYEMISFLEKELGIIVGNVLIPNIKKSDLEELLSHKLAVFFNGKYTKTQSIFKLYPIPVVDSSIPYGISNFFNLCSNILKGIGNESKISMLDSIKNSYLDKYEKSFQEVKNYGIGIIIFDFHIQSILNDTFRGISFLSFLKDMNMNLHFFVYSQGSQVYKKEIESLTLLCKESKNMFLTVSNIKEDLESFLDTPEIQIYYSEISNDLRILSRDKEILGSGDMEYGLEGFFRTLNLIISKCRRVNYIKSIRYF